MKFWHSYLSPRIRERVLRHYLIPSSRFGLEAGLVPFMPQGVPVTLVDIGASSGSFSSAVMAHCGIRRALFVEPQAERCRELAARFPDRRFTISECAVSDWEGSTEMDILNFDYASSLLPVLPGIGGLDRMLDLEVRQRVTVPVRTLDGLLDEVGWSDPIDLLKVDTQGTELQVLKGAARNLKRVRLIWIEVSFRPIYQGSAMFADIHAFLYQQGCRLQSLQDGFRGENRELLQAEALFLGPAA